MSLKELNSYALQALEEAGAEKAEAVITRSEKTEYEPGKWSVETNPDDRRSSPSVNSSSRPTAGQYPFEQNPPAGFGAGR